MVNGGKGLAGSKNEIVRAVFEGRARGSNELRPGVQRRQLLQVSEYSSHFFFRCGHCKRLAPEYEKAATKLKSNDPPVSLAKVKYFLSICVICQMASQSRVTFQVDCTAEKSTCDRFGVSGFPTLKIFRHGEVAADYDGPREAGKLVLAYFQVFAYVKSFSPLISDGIVKYMKSQVGPSSKELESLAELEKFLNNDDHVIIGKCMCMFTRTRTRELAA